MKEKARVFQKAPDFNIYHKMKSEVAQVGPYISAAASSVAFSTEAFIASVRGPG